MFWLWQMNPAPSDTQFSKKGSCCRYGVFGFTSAAGNWKETSVMLQFLWFSVETQYYLFCGLQCLMVEHRTTNTRGCVKASLLFPEPYRRVRAAHRATEWFVSSGLRYRSCFQNYWANCRFRFSLLFQQGNESAEGPSSWLRKQGSVFQVSCTSLVEDQTPTNKGTFS